MRLSRYGELCLSPLTTVVENIEVDFDNIILFKLSGSVFNVDRNVLLIRCYVCSQQSPYYRDKDFKCGLRLVEECIMHVNEKYDCPYVFVRGDLNSRTADRNNYCNYDIPDENSDNKSEGGGWKSLDKAVNTFGAKLLDMCYIHKMRILNGDCDGDREGEFTFVSHSGSSVNDYFLVSLDFPGFKIVQVHVSPRVESLRMPVSLALNTARQHEARATADQATVVTKLVWQDNLTRTFQNNVRSSVFTNTLGEATEQIARDPNKAYLCLFC